MPSSNPKVDTLLGNAKWHEERKTLRAILLACQLTEAVKWGKLCYTFQNSNVVILYGLKDYCALGFFEGRCLKTPMAFWSNPGTIRNRRGMSSSPACRKSLRWNRS